MIERCCEKLERIKKSYVTDLELKKPLSILRYDLDIIIGDILTILVTFLVHCF